MTLMRTFSGAGAAFAVAFSIAVIATAQERDSRDPIELRVEIGQAVVIESEAAADWAAVPPTWPNRIVDGGRTFVAGSGTVPRTVYVFAALAGPTPHGQLYVVQIVDPSRPDPDPDPGPGPRPDPDPDPGPNSAPFPCDGLHVLMIYETGQAIPQPQEMVMFAGPVRDWLRQNAQWRIWDKDVDLSSPEVSETWRRAMGVKRDSIPWLLISDGKRGYSGPLPANVDAFLELAKPFAE